MPCSVSCCDEICNYCYYDVAPRVQYRFTLLYFVCVFFFIQHIFLLDYCERGGVELLVSVLKLTAFIFCFNDAKMNEIDQD